MKFSIDGITVDIEFENNRISKVMRKSIIGGGPLHLSISIYPSENNTSIDIVANQNNEFISTNISSHTYNKNEKTSLFKVELSKIDISGILIINLKCISGNKKIEKNIGFRLGAEKDEIKYYKDYITELSTDDLARISGRTVPGRKPGKKPGKPPEEPLQPSDLLDALVIEGASTRSPIFLIPFQIETRVFDDFLKVRVFPDQIAIDNLKRKLTQKEYFDAQQFNADRTIETWRSLTGKYRPGRAAWIAKEAINVDEEYVFSENDNLSLPKIKLLPKYFVLSLHLDNGQVLRYQSKSINESGLDFISPGTEGLFSGEANWVTDFNNALELGMAFLVDRNELQDVSVIVKITVVGIRPNKNDNDCFDLLTNSFESHYYSSEASFVPYGTPTNNTEEIESGRTSEEDIENWYQREFEANSGDENNARVMAKALGLDAELFSKWKYSSNKTNAISKSLYRSLWPSTVEYFINTFLKDVISEKSLNKLQKHFVEYVRPLGYLPSIKIGKNPYGIFPITQLNTASIDNPYGWNNSAMDSRHLKGSDSEWLEFDNQFHTMVNALANDWLNASSSSEVPKAFNSDTEHSMDEVISQILAMSPNSLNYLLRTFHESYFSDVVIKLIVDMVFFEYISNIDLSDSALLELYTQFQYNMENIGEDWLSMKVALAEKLPGYLSDVLADDSISESIRESLLSNLHTFGNYRERPFPLVRDPNNAEDCPEEYLKTLTDDDAGPDTSNTLLYKLLYRSKYLSKDVNKKSDTTTILDNGISNLFRKLDSNEKLSKANIDLDLKLKDEEVASIVGSLRSANEREILNNVHDFEEVVSSENSEAWDKLLNSVIADISEADLEAHLKGILDITSFRLDAWISSLANKRLDSMRRVEGAENDIIIGGYGILENLPLIEEPYDTLQGGFIHAPSIAHASTSAILKNAFMSKSNDDANPYRFNISSDRIRRALSILSGLREKQNLAELLGYQFERALHDNKLDKYKDEFRSLFNIQEIDTGESEPETQENIYPRNVVNGLKLISHDSEYSSIIETEADKSVIDEIILNIRDSVDAISDLMMQESVHQAVNGNYERCGAALDTASGNSFPIEPESVSVPLPRVTVGNRIGLLFDTDEDIANPSPRERVEPKLATWFAKLLGDTSKIGCTATYLTTSEIQTIDENGKEVKVIKYHKHEQLVTLSDLVLKAIDFLYLSANRPNMGATEIERRIREFVIQKHPETYEDDEKKIKIDFTQYSDIPLADAIEFSNQVLNILGGYKYIKPDDIYKETEKPADELRVDESTVTEPPMFSIQDLEEILVRVTASYDNLIIIKNQLDLFIEPLLIGVNYHNATKSIKTLIGSTYNDDIENLPGIDELIGLLRTSFDNNYPSVSNHISETYKTTLEDNINTQKDLKGFSLWMVVEQSLDQLLLGVYKTVIADNEHISQENQTGINSSQSLVQAINTFVDNLKHEMQSIIEFMRSYAFSLDYYENINLDIIYSISEVLNKRVKKVESVYQRLIDPNSQPEDPININEQIDLLIRCAKSIFGESFIILPNFTMPETEEVETIIDNQDDVLKGHGASRIYLWLQQVAQTHKQVDSFEELLLFTEAWSDDESAVLKPTVLTFQSSDVTAWQALSNEELGIDSNSKRPKASLSVTLFSNTNNLTGKVSGLNIDQWEDVLPLEEVDTAISFHADTPNQKPANCCLLALPSERNEKLYDWNILDLEKIVCDALDLAKIRSVDLDAIPDIHGLIPSIYMPKDNEQDKHPKEYIFAHEISMVSTSTTVRGDANADN